MSRKLLLVSLTLLSLMLMAIGAWAATFHSPNGYSITAPPGWSLNKSGMMGSDIIVITKPQQKFANNLNVRLSAAPAGLTLAMFRSQLKVAYQKQFPGYKYISEKFTTVGGQRAYELIFNHSQGTPLRPLWARQDIIIRSGKLYVFTCTALTSNASRYTESFDTIIDSIHWTGK